MGSQRVGHDWATEQVHRIKVVFSAELVPLERVLPRTSLAVQGLRLPASSAEGGAQVWSLVGELGSKRKKKNKKVECVLPNMFLLVCWTSGFWGQVVPCWKLSALLARLFRSKELYALLQKWLTSFSVEFSIFPSVGQCSHKFPFLDSVAVAIRSCQNGRK